MGARDSILTNNGSLFFAKFDDVVKFEIMGVVKKGLKKNLVYIINGKLWQT